MYTAASGRRGRRPTFKLKPSRAAANAAVRVLRTLPHAPRPVVQRRTLRPACCERCRTRLSVGTVVAATLRFTASMAAPDTTWPSTPEFRHVPFDWQATSTLPALASHETLVLLYHALHGTSHHALLLVAQSRDVTVRDLRRYVSRAQRADRQLPPFDAVAYWLVGAAQLEDGHSLTALAKPLQALGVGLHGGDVTVRLHPRLPRS